MFAQCDAPLAQERSRPQLVTSAPYSGRLFWLPAVGVAAKRQLVAIGGEAVQHPRLRWMGEPQPQRPGGPAMVS